MSRTITLFFFLLFAFSLQPTRTTAQSEATCDTCPVASVQPTASKPLGPADASHGFTTQTKRECGQRLSGPGIQGFPVPDPKCTRARSIRA
jgi:hypothetical protein